MHPILIDVNKFWNIYITPILSYLRTGIKYLEEYRFSIHQNFMFVAVLCTNEGEYG
jgi:hypothetical protein